MNFPPNFQFNQGNLQNFIDCRRRFYLKSIRQLAWPAVESEPFIENEQFLKQGAAFHRLVQQYYIGIHPAALENLAAEPPLDIWWRNFIQHSELPGLASSGARVYPELSLTALYAGYRIVAKFDLITILPDHRVVIYDWKTSRRRPRRQWLAERIQTRLYRHLFYKVRDKLVNNPLEPEQIEMVYWFAGFPDQPERFSYSTAQYQQEEQYFTELLETIAHLTAQDNLENPGAGFPQTSDEKRCAFCEYRSLCDRGIRAGDLNAAQLDETREGLQSFDDFEFNFEQIAEIEF